MDILVFRFRLREDICFPGQMLDKDELLRAGRYRSEVSRREYVQSRAVLRSVLARRLGVGVREVPLRIGPAGKPRLPESRMQFSLSHSDDIGVLAIAEDTPIGVDVEKIRYFPEALSISEQYFAPGEMDITSTESARSDEAFFRCWTRKEAYLKGLGEGLARPLNTFRIASEERSGRLFTPVIDSRLPDTDWFVRSFTPCTGYAGAIAVRRNDVELRQFPCVPAENLLCQETMMCS